MTPLRTALLGAFTAVSYLAANACANGPPERQSAAPEPTPIAREATTPSTPVATGSPSPATPDAPPATPDLPSATAAPASTPTQPPPPVGTPRVTATPKGAPPPLTKGIPTPSTPAPTPEPVVWVPIKPVFPVWPNDKRSGDPVVDRVLDALFSGDPAAIESVMEFFPLPCIASFAVSVKRPFCRSGEAVGTSADWFVRGGEHFRRDEPQRLDFTGPMRDQGLRLVAIHDEKIEGVPSRIVVVLTPTMTHEGQGRDEDCVSATRLTVNTTGFTGILFFCERRSVLLPPDARYLVPVPSSP